jgi:hypothetical protein
MGAFAPVDKLLIFKSFTESAARQMLFRIISGAIQDVGALDGDPSSAIRKSIQRQFNTHGEMKCPSL